MNYLLAVLFLGLSGFLIGRFIKHKSLYPFMSFWYNFALRRETFARTLELLGRMGAKVIVETGTSREGLKGAKSQGAFTIVFGKWAKLHNAVLHSVDISDESVRIAQEEVNRQKLQDNVKIYTSDSVEFLSTFSQPIDLLYLDSYDYSTNPETQRRSQEHHLNEFKAAEINLHRNSIVLIDDCALPGGGKGKRVIEYMESRGWAPIMQRYQVILVQKESDSFTSMR